MIIRTFVYLATQFAFASAQITLTTPTTSEPRERKRSESKPKAAAAKSCDFNLLIGFGRSTRNFFHSPSTVYLARLEFLLRRVEGKKRWWWWAQIMMMIHPSATKGNPICVCVSVYVCKPATFANLSHWIKQREKKVCAFCCFIKFIPHQLESFFSSSSSSLRPTNEIFIHLRAKNSFKETKNNSQWALEQTSQSRERKLENFFVTQLDSLCVCVLVSHSIHCGQHRHTHTYSQLILCSNLLRATIIIFGRKIWLMNSVYTIEVIRQKDCTWQSLVCLCAIACSQAISWFL